MGMVLVIVVLVIVVLELLVLVLLVVWIVVLIVLFLLLVMVVEGCCLVDLWWSLLLWLLVLPDTTRAVKSKSRLT